MKSIMKKILVIDTHPRKESLTNLLADTYEDAAKSGGHTVQRLNIRDLKFDPILFQSYRDVSLEPDIEHSQELINWCEHLIIVTPVWWMSTPALFKGWLDRTLMPGFAFKYKKKSFLPIPERLLKGRSARVIYTQGGPKYLTNIIGFDAFWKALKYGTLVFCGFGPVRRTAFSNVVRPTDARITHMKIIVSRLGKRGK